jgi:predicted DNA-binding transcriptional regulator AlpA
MVPMNANEAKQEGQRVRLFNMKQACDEWGISRWKVYEMIKAGEITPIVNMGKGFKFTGFELKPEMLERL